MMDLLLIVGAFALALIPVAAFLLIRRGRALDKKAEEEEVTYVMPTRFRQRDPNLQTRARSRGVTFRFRDNPARR